MKRGTLTRRSFVRSAGVGVPLWSTSNLTRSYAPEARTKWTRSVPQTIGITRAISGIFYVVTVDGIYTLTNAGTILWTFEPQRGQPTLFPTARIAYVAHGDTIIAFSTVEGRERWRYTGTDSPSVEAVTATNAIITDNGDLVAASRGTGEKQWSVQSLGISSTSPLYYDGTYLYVGTTYGMVYRFTDEGRVNWKRSTNGKVNIHPVGTAANHILAWVPERGRLYGMWIGDKRRIWHVDLANDTTSFLGRIYGVSVYVIDGARVRALDASDGTERWSVAIDPGKKWDLQVFGNSVYLGTDGQLRAFSTDSGNQRWQFTTGDQSHVSAVGTMNDSLVVSCRQSSANEKDRIVGLSTGDGHVRWQYSHRGGISRDVYLDAGMVYFGTTGGVIRGITPTTSTYYDTLRTVVSPLGVAAGGLLGAAVIGGGYRRYRGNDSDEDPESEPEPDHPMWNGYELRERLDGETHRAVTSDGEAVILRRFRDPPEDFERDVREWATLDFDGVQGVHDWGTDPEPWVALESVNGQPVAEVSDGSDERNVADIVGKTAEIVHRGHRRGVFHGALSAENVVVTDSGVVVTDWRFTGNGDDSRDEGVPADVRRLGELAWSLLPDEPSESLRDVLDTATASNRDERYESALEFADMLRWAVRDN